MHYIHKIVLSVLLIVMISSNASASQAKLSVNLPTLSITLNYSQPVRLSQLLSDAQKLLDKDNINTFWLAAQLLEKDNNEQISQLKNNILATLALLSHQYPKSQLKADRLSTFIKQHHFNYRHFISLDNDLVRIQAEKDPLLTGKLTLLTPARVNRIRLISGTTKQSFAVIEHAAIDDYIKQVNLPTNSDTTLVYIIQPDGMLSQSRNASWQHTPTFFAPGASLFVGFKSLPDQYASVNQQIAELLRYITPLTQGSKI